MVVYRYRQRLLRSILPDDVVTELLIDLLRCWYLPCLQAWLGDSCLLLLNDFAAEVNAFIAYVHACRSRNQPLHLILTFAAKRAAISRTHIFRVCHVCHLSCKRNITSGSRIASTLPSPFPHHRKEEMPLLQIPLSQHFHYEYQPKRSHRQAPPPGHWQPQPRPHSPGRDRAALLAPPDGSGLSLGDS